MEWNSVLSQVNSDKNVVVWVDKFVLFNQADNFALSSCNVVGFWEVLQGIHYLWGSEYLFYHDIYMHCKRLYRLKLAWLLGQNEKHKSFQKKNQLFLSKLEEVTSWQFTKPSAAELKIGKDKSNQCMPI